MGDKKWSMFLDVVGCLYFVACLYILAYALTEGG